jgi:hypothetical protein
MGYKVKYSKKEKKENKKDKPDKEQSGITFNNITDELNLFPNCWIDARDKDDYVFI